MIRRAAALAAIGGLAGGALVLGVAAPAQAVIIDYRAYQQTLPASVIDGGTLTDEEKVAWTNGTRAGVVSTPVAPIGSVPTRSGGTLPGIFGAVGMLLSVGGQVDLSLSFSDDLWWKEADRPDWIPQDEWDACSGGGDASNLFDGFSDWVASVQGTWAGGAGMDCAAIRDDWLLEANPDYEPTNIGADNGLAHYPFAVTSNGVTVTFGSPVYSTVTYSTGSPSVTRQEGWVIPVTMTGGGTADPLLRIYPDLVSASGVTSYTATTTPAVMPRSLSASVLSAQPCGTGAQCMVVDKYFGSTTGLPTNWRSSGTTIATIGAFNVWQTSPKPPVAPLPFVDPMNGTYAPSTGKVKLMTTVWTEAGNRYSCTTESFVETAPTVPQPCEPLIPEWEIITERKVEMVPESEPSYIPGSNPSRGIQTTTVPDVVRDWQRDFPDCDETLCLLDLELEGVGSCFDNPDECAGWYSDPNKTTKYTCIYGGVEVDLAQCVKYARLFEPNALQSGTAYPSPSSPNPAASPGSGTQTSTAPGAATPPGSSVANPSQPRNCFPTGWGVFNPLEWIFQPVKCALEWAFVPRQEVVNNITSGMRAKWLGSSLISLLGVLEQGSDLVLGGTGCAGPNVSVNIFGGAYSGNPLSACADPMAGVAAFSRTFTMVAAWVMAIASIARSIAGVVGFTKLGGDS